jgi:hypothetical protein
MKSHAKRLIKIGIRLTELWYRTNYRLEKMVLGHPDGDSA